MGLRDQFRRRSGSQRPAPEEEEDDGSGWNRYRIAECLGQEKAFQVMSVDGVSWLDPFTRSAVEAPFEWRAAAISWLAEKKPWRKVKKPAGYSEMMRLRWFLFLKDQLSKDERLRHFLPDGRWLNPLTAKWEARVRTKKGPLGRETVMAMSNAMARAEVGGAGCNLKKDFELKGAYDQGYAAYRRQHATPVEEDGPVITLSEASEPVDSPTVRQRRRLQERSATPAGSTSHQASGPLAAVPPAPQLPPRSSELPPRSPGVGGSAPGLGVNVGVPSGSAPASLKDTVPNGLDPQHEAELNAVGYEVKGILGRGGMGSVFKALQLSLERTVALKIRVPIEGEKPKFIDRFLREARAAAQVADPCVVTVFDVGRTASIVYMAMEYLSGGDVDTLVEDHGPLDEARTLAVGRDALQGLRAIHDHDIIHRDIKTSNLFIGADGRVKIGDLGIARDMDHSRKLTNERAVIGTPAFMPPEQSIPGGSLDRRSDLYSVGVSFFHMLTGTLPYPGDNPLVVLRSIITEPVPDVRALNPAVSAGMAEFVMKMMAKEPSNRPADCREALALLAQV